MPFSASCTCGAAYQLKDEFAGKQLQCTHCHQPFTATPAAAIASHRQAHPAFDRDRFLLRQKMMSISQKYTVSNEQGQPIIFVERPAHIGQQLLAALAGVVTLLIVGAVICGGAVVLLEGKPDMEPVMAIAIIFGVLAAIVACFAVAIMLSPKRHVLFYTDELKSEKLMDVLQDKKWQPITVTYTLRDATGNVLALFRKNMLYNLIRKRWVVLAPDGVTEICRAWEDSIILSLLRRWLGPLFGLLRTNFIITPPNSEIAIGEFNRKFTIVDRYVLDMTPDSARMLDRRIALGLGVMLDTGERR